MAIKAGQLREKEDFQKLILEYLELKMKMDILEGILRISMPVLLWTRTSYLNF